MILFDLRHFFVLACGLMLAMAVPLEAQDAPAAAETYDMDRIGAALQAAELIRTDSLNGKDVDALDLLRDGQEALDGQFDPYTRLLDEDGYHALREEIRGEFGGVGLVLGRPGGVLTVFTVLVDSPAGKAGVRAADRILSIDRQPTLGMTMTDAVHRLRGAPGSKVVVTVQATDGTAARELILKRAKVQVPSVRDAVILDGTGVAYVRLTRFHDFTAAQLATALQRLRESRPAGLILDLRDNPGGALTAAVDVCSLFLAPGVLVVSTVGNQPGQVHRHVAVRKAGACRDLPLVLLVNGGTASAAEITAGCLQEWGRAKLVGKPTFGKGTAQNVVGLPDGSGLRLTTATWRLPKGQPLPDEGLTPDLPLALTVAEAEAMSAAPDPVPQSQTVALLQDPYVRRAVAALALPAVRAPELSPPANPAESTP